MSSHCFLNFIVPDEKSTIYVVEVSIYVMNCFLLLLSRVLVFIVQQFDYGVSNVDLFEFITFGIY